MCAIASQVNTIHCRHGVPPAAQPALRAVVAAWLLHNHLLGVSTVTQAVVLTNSSRPSVEAALTILKAEDEELLDLVLTGYVSLALGARHVKHRAGLIASFRSACPEDRVAFGQAVGAAALFDDVVLPSL